LKTQRNNKSDDKSNQNQLFAMSQIENESIHTYSNKAFDAQQGETTETIDPNENKNPVNEIKNPVNYFKNLVKDTKKPKAKSKYKETDPIKMTHLQIIIFVLKDWALNSSS
jgi:hypothetical protein